MKIAHLVAFGTVLAVSVSLAGVAHADSVVSGSVWQNATVYPNTFPSTAPSGTPDATFTIGNPGGDDFSMNSVVGKNKSADYTLGSFLTSGGDTLTYLTGSANAGNSINNDVFQFTGWSYLTAGTVYSITHDDGMYLFLSGQGLSNFLEINAGAPTAPDGSSFSVTTSGLYSFDLLYAEVNGPGAQLSGNLGDIVPSPEPGSIFLLGSGLLVAAFMVRRRITV